MFFKLSPFERSIEKTDAESVEAIVEASSSDVSSPMPADSIVIPNIHHIITPLISAVMKTPIVARMTPFAITGRISEIFVSIPPEKRMMHNAMVPMF